MSEDLQLLSEPRPANPQLFENNAELVEEYLSLADNPDALHGVRKPNFGIVHEKPEHRLVLYLKLEGLTNREVSERTGYTEAWVSQVTRQPWFQQRLLQELRVAGRTGAAEYLKVQTLDSIVKLVDLRDNAKSEAVQAACAMNIIDRVFGKPVQRTEVKMETSKKVEQVENIQAAVAALDEQEKVLTEKLSKYVN